MAELTLETVDWKTFDSLRKYEQEMFIARNPEVRAIAHKRAMDSVDWQAYDLLDFGEQTAFLTERPEVRILAYTREMERMQARRLGEASQEVNPGVSEE